MNKEEFEQLFYLELYMNYQNDIHNNKLTEKEFDKIEKIIIKNSIFLKIYINIVFFIEKILGRI